MPRLKVDLLPADHSASFSIGFSYPQSSPAVVEQQVTSLVEGACAQLQQVKKITSVSNYNGGVITISFDPTADIDFKQFELTALIRQIFPKLPQQVSYPILTRGIANRQNRSPLLVYSINAPLQTVGIKEEMEGLFARTFAGVPDVGEISVSGAESAQITLQYNKAQCEILRVRPEDIINAIESYFSASYVGSIQKENGESYFVKLNPRQASIAEIENIFLLNDSKEMVQLKNVARVYIENKENQRYFRINGKNSVRVSIYGKQDENSLLASKRIKKIMKRLTLQLPQGFQLIQDHDDTEFLNAELLKGAQRAAIAVIILMVFILVFYRNAKYLANLLSALLVSLFLTILLVWLLGLTIHLYTIAGLAISFGMMMDNAIVMLDYYHQWKDKRVFAALLTSTLVTVAAISLVFLLPSEQRNQLADFSIIIIIALISSLLSVFWFTPGLYKLTIEGIKSRRDTSRQPDKRNALAATFIKVYSSTITSIARYRPVFVALLILSFGIPVFLLPAKWEGRQWYHDWYNQSIGSQRYQTQIKPIVDKWLGGTSRIFSTQVSQNSGFRDPEQTKLYVNARLPYGNTPQQMNGIIIDFEQFLTRIEGVEKFITTIYSGQRGLIEIYFKEEVANSSLPYQLKSKLIARSLDWGGVEWNIYGVGLGFNNAGSNELPSFSVMMKGYNYYELEKQAMRLSAYLTSNERVKNVNINERLSYEERQSKEYVLNLEYRKMALHNTSKEEIFSTVRALSKPQESGHRIAFNHTFYNMVIKESGADNYSNYDLFARPMRLDSSRVIRIGDFGQLQLSSTENSIHREDRQYVRMVGFEYAGLQKFGKEYLQRTLDHFNQNIPIGYTATIKTYQWSLSGSNSTYQLLFLLIGIIFLLCSVLFENLKQAFCIISIIPISFIGIFVAFSFNELYFDQGGYASFVLSGGLVSNAAIFIINDCNHQRKSQPGKSWNAIVIDAISNRAHTILLTSISTCCGLFPFLIGGQNEVFWYSLAIGTIAGLLFSLLAIFFVLPVFLWHSRIHRP